jgi:hypothetical protein
MYKIKSVKVGVLVRKHMTKLDGTYFAKILKDFTVSNIQSDEQHFWSPQLSLSFEPDEEDKTFTTIRSLYGPKPTVWIFLTYGYVALAILGTLLRMYGFSQYSLIQDAVILWAAPILALITFMLYMVHSLWEILVPNKFLRTNISLKIQSVIEFILNSRQKYNLIAFLYTGYTDCFPLGVHQLHPYK